MSDRNSILVLAIVILVMFSSLFSAIETAYSSASKIRLKNMANDKVNGASAALKILDNFDQFLTTVLVGNNIVNISMATLGTLLFTHLYGDNGATISTAVITLVVLIFGEVTPKSIAKQIPEIFACKTAGFVRFIELIFLPLSSIFHGLTILLYKIVHLETIDSDISDELITMVDEAEKDGDLEEHESDLISAAIEFNDEEVGDVLTPRVDVVAIDLGAPLDEVERVFRFNSYSRLPVYEKSVDNIVGVIHEKDFYNLYYQGKERNRGVLRSIIKPVIYTSEGSKISALLKQLQAAKLHLAVVLDEYGGTQGIITLEDIIEELVGEIWDEHDTVKEYYEQLSENVYLVKCDADIDDMLERFDIEPEEDEYDFITVSGWVIHELERIPRVGDEFDYRNLHIRVTKADQRKVLEIRVEIHSKKDEDKEEE